MQPPGPDLSSSTSDSAQPISLRLLPTIHKVLISTPTHFVGGYDTPQLLVTHALPAGAHPTVYSPFSSERTHRSFFILTFPEALVDDTPVEERGVFPNRGYIGEALCALFSLLFGKRFDNHGCVESWGFSRVPDLETLTPTAIPAYGPFTNTPRRDLPMDLRLERIELLRPIIEGSTPAERTRVFQIIARFYLQALQRVDRNPALAFLDLVTAGEVLADHLTVPPEEKYDDALRDLLQRIEEALGTEDRARIEGRLFQIRRRFGYCLTQQLTPAFFNGSESHYPFGALQANDLRQRLLAAYDLRSRYIHTGEDFGAWVQPRSPTLEDIMLGTPVVDDPEYRKILTRTPTFVGLERVIRYAALRFAHQYLTPIAEELT